MNTSFDPGFSILTVIGSIFVPFSPDFKKDSWLPTSVGKSDQPPTPLNYFDLPPKYYPAAMLHQGIEIVK